MNDAVALIVSTQVKKTAHDLLGRELGSTRFSILRYGPTLRPGD